MKRSPLLRRSPLRSRSKNPSAYRVRPRDYPFMAWVRRQPCIVRELPPDPNRITPCSGHVEADHLGARAVGRKADDRTCAPLCRQHHRERTDHHGAFFALDRNALILWRVSVLERVAAEAAKAGV